MKNALYACAAAAAALVAGAASAQVTNHSQYNQIYDTRPSPVPGVGANSGPENYDWSRSVGIPNFFPGMVLPNGYALPRGFYRDNYGRVWRDRDRDGVPNARDRDDNNNGVVDGRERRRGDRDRDGVANWQDRHPGDRSRW